jgi:hypothetical protein
VSSLLADRFNYPICWWVGKRVTRPMFRYVVHIGHKEKKRRLVDDSRLGRESVVACVGHGTEAFERCTLTVGY